MSCPQLCMHGWWRSALYTVAVLPHAETATQVVCSMHNDSKAVTMSSLGCGSSPMLRLCAQLECGLENEISCACTLCAPLCAPFRLAKDSGQMSIWCPQHVRYAHEHRLVMCFKQGNSVPGVVPPSGAIGQLRVLARKLPQAILH